MIYNNYDKYSNIIKIKIKCDVNCLKKNLILLPTTVNSKFNISIKYTVIFSNKIAHMIIFLIIFPKVNENRMAVIIRNL